VRRTNTNSIIIKKAGLGKSDRSRICKILRAKAATKLGVAYEVADPAGIPAELATNAPPGQHTLTDQPQTLRQLVEGLAYMFTFFQQHKVGTPVEPDEKVRLKTILALVKAQAIKP
jgi:uncharacterized lipoprotein NlpE involved in copper resistance